jgi:hypothetical protein
MQHRIHTEGNKEGRDDLAMLRAIARYETHGGYTWAAVLSDGALLCEPCVRSEYRQVFRATRDRERSGWAVIGITNSGEMESHEQCAHCGRTLHSDSAPD